MARSKKKSSVKRRRPAVVKKAAERPAPEQVGGSVEPAGKGTSRLTTVLPWLIPVIVVLPLLLLLAKGWTGQQLLFGIDYSTTNAVAQRRVLDQNDWYTWMPFFRMGSPATKLLGVSTWLLQWIDPHRFLSVNYTLIILLGGLGMFLWTRILGCSRLVAAFAAGAFMYSSGMIGYIYPGHLNRMDCAYWGPWLFFLVERARRKKSLWSHGWVGVPLALMLLAHDPQTAMYTGVWLAIYYMIGWVRDARAHGFQPGKWLIPSYGGPVLAALVCVGFALQALLFFAWHMNAKGLGGVRTDADRWEYATMFSFPPEETATFFASGYLFGGASQEAYSGRVPLKLHDDYMGLWVVVMAGLGLWACRRRMEARFLGAMALVSLLIAFGRFFPLYQWIYALPTMKMQRTPWRWIYLVQLAMPALAALGMEASRRWLDREDGARAGWVNKFVWGMVLGSALLFLLGLIGWAGARGAAGADATQIMRVQLRWLAIWRTGLVLFLGSGWLLLTMRMRWPECCGFRRSSWFLSGLLVLTMADLGINAHRFIQWVGRDFYRPDALAQTLIEDPDEFRVKLGPGGTQYMNQLNTFHFRYHDINSADPPSSERIPRLYQDFLDRLQEGKIPFEQYLKIFNIKYLVWPQPLPEQVLSVFTPLMSGQAAHLYRYENWMRRFSLIPRWEVVWGENQLDRMSTPTWNPSRTVFISDPGQWPEGFAAEGEVPDQVIPSKITPLRVTATALDLQVETDRSAILLLSQYYDPDWTVRVDGQPDRLLRANHLMQAVALGPGSHRVEFRHAPSMVGLKVTRAGWLLLSFALVFSAARYLRRRSSENPERDGTSSESTVPEAEAVHG